MRKKRLKKGGRLTPYWLCAPFVACFALFVLVPIAYAAHMSLYSVEHSGLGLGTLPSNVFVGLHNYSRALTDSTFYSGLRNVVVLGLVQVPVMLALALALALLLDSAQVRLRRTFRTAMFVPYAVPTVISAILWGFLFVPELSPIVRILKDMSLPAPNILSPGLVLWALVNVVTWEWTGYNIVILVAALQAVPSELYEAARVEGASEWHIVRHIKLPLVSPALVMTAIFSIIGTLQLFNEPTVLSANTTSINSVYTPNMYIFNLAFSAQNPNYASAVAVVLAVITFFLSFGALRLVRRQAGV